MVANLGSWLLTYTDIPFSGIIYILQQIDVTKWLTNLPVAKLFSSNISTNSTHTLLLPSSAEFIEQDVRIHLYIYLTVLG